MNRYNPSEIEPKWQKVWQDDKSYVVHDDDKRPKYYHLIEFPYPSGAGLHVGHTRPYFTFDVMSRWRRMTGENVLFPFGWDSFGLPAEQYAIKTGVHPSITVAQNIDTFRDQVKRLGIGFDWSREFSTADPSYYKWTQWIFLNLFKHGLAYQDEQLVWWCEGLKSVLADEEVINGRSERGDYPCERRPLRQWMLAITRYADRLDEDLEDVDYIEPVKVQQRNWIGRSKGAEIIFKIAGSKSELKVFTTRADTLFGATYMVLAPEHPLVAELTDKAHKSEVDKYVKQTASKSDLDRQEDTKSKTGVFIGAYAINPLSQAKIPIWISDYVLMGYGTGAIMAVPAHDQRDYLFANKFNLPIINVVDPVEIRADSKELTSFVKKKKVVVCVVNKDGKILTINWGPKLGGRLLIGGTMESGETVEATALREVKEETGYTDLKPEEIGQETFYYKYYAFSKEEGHDAVVKFVLLKLAGDHRVEPKLDKSEKNNFKVEWVDKAQAEKDIVEPLHRYCFEKFILGNCYSGEGRMTNSASYNGLTSSAARDKIVADLAKKSVAKEVTNYKLRDWVFSRQRYWGEPFPIVWVSASDYKKAKGVVAEWLPSEPVSRGVGDKLEYALPIPPEYLPVKLPQVDDFQPQGLGKGPLSLAKDWCEVWFNPATGETISQTKPKPADDWLTAKRETDTMPNWAGSSWYFLRYLDPRNDKQLASPDKLKMWMPVNWYNGGMEHTTLHLLYSRFWHKFLFDIGVVNTKEPYTKRTSHGVIIASDGRKMSKSLGNVVDPLDVVRDYGSDSLRLFICFIGPFEQTAAWNANGLAGCRRFIDRLWVLVQEFLDTKPNLDSNPTSIKNQELLRIVNAANKRVSVDIQLLGFNTAVAALMEAVNQFYKLKVKLTFKDASTDWRATFNYFVILTAPFMPHVAEELWHQLGNSGSVLAQAWQVWDEASLKNDKVTIVVQINGKLRAQLRVDQDASEEEVIKLARADQKVASWLKETSLKKTVYVKQRLVNFVTD